MILTLTVATALFAGFVACMTPMTCASSNKNLTATDVAPKSLQLPLEQFAEIRLSICIEAHAQAFEAVAVASAFRPSI